MSTQSAIEDFGADTPEPSDEDDDVERACPFCDDPVPSVKIPMHIAEDCERAPREVEY